MTLRSTPSRSTRGSSRGTSAPAQERSSPRPVPRQRTPRGGGKVSTFWDGARWSYRVEGQPALGHGYADIAPAIAGGRYLARTLGVEHVIEDETGAVRERVDWGRQCGCHPRERTRPVA